MPDPSASERSVLIGVPLYEGWDLVGETLDSIKAQTFGDYRVLISVDGADQRSFDACGPWLDDPRFEIVLQPGRLGWADNINWLVGQLREDFFVYWQHDDLAEPTYLQEMVEHAARHPEASAVYCRMQQFGEKSRIGSVESFTGFRLERVMRMIRENVPNVIRCLNRADAIRAALPITAVGPWAVTLARMGELHQLPKPLYRRRMRAGSLSHQMRAGGQPQLRAYTLQWAVGNFRAALPAVPQDERRRLLVFILDLLLDHRPMGNFQFDFRGAGAQEAQAFVRDYLDGVRAATGYAPFAKLLRAPNADARLRALRERFEEDTADTAIIDALLAGLGAGG